MLQKKTSWRKKSIYRYLRHGVISEYLGYFERPRVFSFLPQI